MVKHSPCSSYKELNPVLKLPDLVLNWHTSIDCDHIELLLIVSELLELCRDLEGVGAKMMALRNQTFEEEAK